MITESLNKIINEIPSNVKLIAISKTKSKEEILEAYDHGQRIFGENKVQEMTEKHSSLPKDIKWHMVGHVQRNKIKYMAPYVDLIHGIDSFKSLRTINKEGEKNNRIIKCLLQLKISSESTKFGLEIQSPEYKKLSFVKVCGIMAMASFTSDLELVREEFNIANKLYNRIKKVNSDFQILSMGMSNDYKIAIEAGSNMIRIGSLIFGSRN